MDTHLPQPLTMRRPYVIGLGATVLLVLTVLTGLYLGAKTQERFRNIAGSWSAFSEQADMKGVWISEIRGHLGFGGIIHDFKNYVLRKDDSYVQAVKHRLVDFYRVVDRYLENASSHSERADLRAIRATVADYESKIPIAEQAAREAWAVPETDRLVRVDDRAAIAALGALEAIWQQNRGQTTTEIVRAVDEGEALINLGFRFLFGLAIVALALFALYYLLVSELQTAVHRLSSELVERLRAEASAKKLQRAVEQSPATILITDTAGHIEYVNRRFEEVTGYSRDEVIGRTPKFLQSGDTEPEQYAKLKAMLASGQDWRGVFRNRKKDGSAYWAETALLPLTDETGAISNFIGIGEDITERRRAREQVIKAQKMEAVGLLAGGIAHDFNNVLTTILGAAHLAALDAPANSDLAHEIAQIEIAARRARALVQQLLTFARRQPGEPRNVNLHHEIAEVVRLVRASIPATIQFDLALGERPAWVRADPTQLHQVLMNLCRNAAEAVPSETGIIRIALESGAGPNPAIALGTHVGDWVRMTVSDNGPGVPDAIAKRIFDPFFTTKPIGKGTGLGLTMVSTLVEDMKGCVQLISRPGEGACFEIVLPQVAAGEVASTDQPELPRGTEHILLVDDEADVVATVRRVLMRLGYRVAAYTEPRTALTAFTEAPDRFDIVVTDLVMPDMTGEALARSIWEVRPNCPILLCTAYRPNQLMRAEDATFAVIDKPTEVSELSRKIRRLLAHDMANRTDLPKAS